jgi:hypothetical protein
LANYSFAKKACGKADHSQTIINAKTAAGALLYRARKIAVTVFEDRGKGSMRYVEKELSTAVLADLFQGISFLRFLEHF